MRACHHSAPLELVQLMITKAKLDSRKRCLLAITSHGGWTALHWAACFNRDLAVLELLILEHPLALQTSDSIGRTALQFATLHYRPTPIIFLLVDATNALAVNDYAALAVHDYAALAARVHGSAFALRCLASPSYTARIAVRTSVLLCLKNVLPDVSVAPTEPLDLHLAQARLGKDVWRVILEFV